MATTQYIGARYVPAFYTNPDDNSNAWRAGVEYEALTIVTDVNQSYTAKIPVPASVGRPSENPTYWILTGAYNAQVEQYRQAVAGVQTDVDALTGRVDDIETDLSEEITPDNECYLFISDSYGGEYGNTSGDTTTIWSELANKLNMPGRLWFGTFVASGFAYNPGNGTFLTKLQDNAANIAANVDVSKITKVVVVAGRNDYLAANETAVFSAMQAFDSYVKTTYPNAKRYYGFIANGDNNSAGSKADLILKSYRAYRRCNEFGGIYLTGVEAGIHVIDGLASDWIHPSIAGKKAIANAVYEALTTGSFVASYPPASAVFTPRNGFGFISGYGLELNELIENNALYTFSENLLTGITIPAQNFTDSTEYTLTFADISGGYLLHPFGSVTIPVIVEIDKTPFEGKLIITAPGGVALKFRPYKSVANVNAITFTAYNSMNVWPLVYC